MKVLLTVGYGAGFTEWNDPNIAVDQRVVEAYEANPEMSVDEFRSMCESFGYEDVNVIREDLELMKIEEVPDDVYFRIRSYDGWEYVEVFNPDEWLHS